MISEYPTRWLIFTTLALVFLFEKEFRKRVTQRLLNIDIAGCVYLRLDDVSLIQVPRKKYIFLS